MSGLRGIPGYSSRSQPGTARMQDDRTTRGKTWGVETGGEKDKKGAGGDGSGYEERHLGVGYLMVFRVLQAGMNLSARQRDPKCLNGHSDSESRSLWSELLSGWIAVPCVWTSVPSTVIKTLKFINLSLFQR